MLELNASHGITMHLAKQRAEYLPPHGPSEVSGAQLQNLPVSGHSQDHWQSKTLEAPPRLTKEALKRNISPGRQWLPTNFRPSEYLEAPRNPIQQPLHEPP